MNAPAIELLTADRKLWPLAGDQFYVTMSLDVGSLPPGARIGIGEKILEVSAVPHTGCGEFSGRFGAAALALVNSDEGRRLRLRGMNAKVVRSGIVRSGDPVQVVAGAGR
jgi:MOSC domain-containing protein YiiM